MNVRAGSLQWVPRVWWLALVTLTMAGFITVVYVAVVVGLGNALGTEGEPNLGLSIAATALVAGAFQPVRERVQRFASRLVYGHRATPYEVLARFCEKVAGIYATEDVLPSMAKVVAEGTRADRVEVWLRVGRELRLAASWPPAAHPFGPSLPLADAELPALPDADRVIPVRHQGELLGALTVAGLAVAGQSGESPNPTTDRLLSDLAAQAGLVLRNVRLAAELRVRLEQISRQAVELRASRQRIVAAQDEERRRLERNIHDGAQQHLVALAVKIRLARGFAESNPHRARALLKELHAEAADSLETLRDLARGIYPPLLAEQGLAAALVGPAKRAGVPVDVHAEGIRRYPPEVEAAVYFCCLEALQNLTKYSRASKARIELRQSGHELAFEVSDDGVGFDPSLVSGGSGLQNMVDRVEALGGALHVATAAGMGTTLRGRIPGQQLVPAERS
ncbi:MAG TPA: sensor histidine kinase [Actinomycetota bacterium]